MSSQITIIVKLFAILRDRAGVAQTTLTLPAASTAAAAGAQLSKAFPSIAPFLPRTVYAINQEYAKPSTELRNGDELAFIPPVSGG